MLGSASRTSIKLLTMSLASIFQRSLLFWMKYTSRRTALAMLEFALIYVICFHMFMSSAPLLEVRPEMSDAPAPPAVPTILLDSRFGMQPEEAGFDFEVFYDLARTAGLDNGQISAYRHTFSADLGKTDRMGFFDEDTGSTVYVPQCVRVAQKLPQMLEKRSAQKRFGADVYRDLTLSGVIREVSVHEFGHYVDALTGNVNRARRIERVKGYAAAMVAIAGAADMICSDTVHAPAVSPVFGAAAILATVAAEMQHRKHADSLIEQPAYDFQERYGHVPILKIGEAAIARLQ